MEEIKMAKSKDPNETKEVILDQHNQAEHDRDIVYLSELRRRADLHLRQIGFDLAIFDPSRDQVHILNPVAAVVWKHISPDRSFINIVEALQLSFREKSPNRFENDVKNILGKFRDLGLLIQEGQKLPTTKRQKYMVPFPDDEISSFSGKYVKPRIKSFTLEELQEKFQTINESPAPFADLAIIEVP